MGQAAMESAEEHTLPNRPLRADDSSQTKQHMLGLVGG
jgi:hypothetical protein